MYCARYASANKRRVYFAKFKCMCCSCSLCLPFNLFSFTFTQSHTTSTAVWIPYIFSRFLLILLLAFLCTTFFSFCSFLSRIKKAAAAAVKKSASFLDESNKSNTCHFFLRSLLLLRVYTFFSIHYSLLPSRMCVCDSFLFCVHCQLGAKRAKTVFELFHCSLYI